jgi:hypothetical protein
MEDKIKVLKSKLEEFGTRDLLGYIATHFISYGSNPEEIAYTSDIFNKTKLMSPQKQYHYLAGLLLSTDYCPTENENKSNMNDDLSKFEELEKDIQNITFDYIRGFISFEDYKADDETKMKKFVSMDAFSSYFDMDVLRYEEQTISLIKSLYSRFDSEIVRLTSLCIDDYLSFYNFINDKFTESYDRIKNLRNDMDKVIQRFLLEELEKAEDETYQDTDIFISEFTEAIELLSAVKKEDIVDKFGGEKAKLLLGKFSLARKKRPFKYYNETNPFTQKPLTCINEQIFFVVHPKFLLSAIYEYVSSILEDSNNSFSDQYRKHKAAKVEELVLNHLKRILGDNAKYHTSVCEEYGTKEHDLLIEYGRYIIIGEVKSSKVREPFFNPDKAYTRIKDHFLSASGIGGAYVQAINLKKYIESNNSIVLFENMTAAFELSKIRQKIIIPCVFTLNQFGGIAINTSMILKPEYNQPYPWVCNLHDLENIGEIIDYLKKRPEDFIDYIQWRIKYHDKLMSSDELDILESFLFDKDIRIVKQDKLLFLPTGPDLIDKIYFEKHGIPFSYSPINSMNIIKKKKIGRNEPCPCGSGKKFKKCCIDKK